jgi:hypothetical protein
MANNSPAPAPEAGEEDPAVAQEAKGNDEPLEGRM